MILGLIFIFISGGDWGAGEEWAKVSTATFSTKTKDSSEQDKNSAVLSRRCPTCFSLMFSYECRLGSHGLGLEHV